MSRSAKAAGSRPAPTEQTIGRLCGASTLTIWTCRGRLIVPGPEPRLLYPRGAIGVSGRTWRTRIRSNPSRPRHLSTTSECPANLRSPIWSLWLPCPSVGCGTALTGCRAIRRSHDPDMTSQRLQPTSNQVANHVSHRSACGLRPGGCHTS